MAIPVAESLEGYPEAGCCLLRGAVSLGMLLPARSDILGILASRKAAPGYDPARHYTDFAYGLHKTGPGVQRLFRSDPFPDLAACLLGPDVDFRFTSTLTKTAEKGGHVDWHQDAAYDPDPDHPKFIAWIAVTDSLRDNGCLRVLPGSHRDGMAAHGPSATHARDKAILAPREEDALDVEMEAGDVILLHPFLHHASRPNASGRLRIGLLAGFMLPKKGYLPVERDQSFRYLRGGRREWGPVGA